MENWPSFMGRRHGVGVTLRRLARNDAFDLIRYEWTKPEEMSFEFAAHVAGTFEVRDGGFSDDYFITTFGAPNHYEKNGDLPGRLGFRSVVRDHATNPTVTDWVPLSSRISTIYDPNGAQLVALEDDQLMDVETWNREFDGSNILVTTDLLHVKHDMWQHGVKGSATSPTFLKDLRVVADRSSGDELTLCQMVYDQVTGFIPLHRYLQGKPTTPDFYARAFKSCIRGAPKMPPLKLANDPELYEGETRELLASIATNIDNYQLIQAREKSASAKNNLTVSM